MQRSNIHIHNNREYTAEKRNLLQETNTSINEVDAELVKLTNVRMNLIILKEKLLDDLDIDENGNPNKDSND
jgi:hypothetical protein